MRLERPFAYVWGWSQPAFPYARQSGYLDRERKGEPCRVMARGSKNSILVEFEDGYRVVTSRHGVKKRYE